MKSKIEINKIKLSSYETEYTLTRKNIKNVNLRVKSDGSIWVSAPFQTKLSYIENFMHSKSDYILSSIKKFKETEKNHLNPKVYTKDEILYLKTVVDEIYPLFVNYHIAYPVLKTRRMISRWGSCMPSKNQITLNTALLETPKECIEYVVLHEFAHFIHPNHSKAFYEFVAKLMPDWKERKKKLDTFTLR